MGSLMIFFIGNLIIVFFIGFALRILLMIIQLPIVNHYLYNPLYETKARFTTATYANDAAVFANKTRLP